MAINSFKINPLMKVFSVLRVYGITMLLAGTAILQSCGSDANADKDDLLDDTDTIKTAVLNVAGELFSIPSPIQTALLVQKSGVVYDKNVLSDTKKANIYSTDFAKALNLGVYGADLGYVSLYNQSQDALSYLAAIKQLSDKLGITAAFDAATMDRIAKNITNKDSMTVLVSLAYRGSDAYLKNNQRNDVSTLILAGGWIESMNFSIAAYRSKPNNEIRYRIAEQKQALTSIVKILGGYEGEEIKQLTSSLTDLATEYESIQFKYNFVEPVHDTIKKVTYINSTSEVIISDEQLQKITNKLNTIRRKIVDSAQS